MNMKTMNMKTKIFGALALGVAGIGTAGYAATASMETGDHEAMDDAAEAAAFADARISLVDAVAIAERSTGAAAAEAEFEAEDGSSVFEVGLYNASGQELEAVIDANTGEVLHSGADDEDNEGGEDAD